MKRRRVSTIISQFNPWLIGGFLVMIVTGSLLFSGDPLSFYTTVFFKIKMLLIVLAGLNVFVFNITTGRTVEQWDLAAHTPRRAKVAAILSLVFWVAIVAAGRAIAYALPPP